MSEVNFTSVVRDPVHGDIPILSLEKNLIDDDIFQRLRRIKQLGTAYVVYPEANHTRFGHALGTMHVASLIGRELEHKSEFDLSNLDFQMLRLAALLHDTGHGPFPQSFEAFLQARYGLTTLALRTRIVKETSIGDTIEDGGYSKQELLSLYDDGGHADSVLRNVLSSPLDADKIDYVMRDSYYTGVETFIPLPRLVRSFQLWRNRVVHTASSVPIVEQFLFDLYRLYNTLYYHRTIRSADIMIQEALFAADQETPLFDPSQLEEYLKLDDAELMSYLLGIGAATPYGRRASRLAAALRRRQLLPVAFETSLESVNQMIWSSILKPGFVEYESTQSVRKRISDLIGIPAEEIFVDVSMFDPRLFQVYLEITKDAPRTLVDVSPVSRLLLPISFLRIYTFPEHLGKVRDSAQKIATQVSQSETLT